MELPTIEKYTKKKGPNHTANWQLLGEEVSNYFGKPLYWLFHKFPEDKIIDAYKYCKREGISKYQILLALLNKK